MQIDVEHPLFPIDTRCKPILKWAGGKGQTLPQLVRHFPKRFARFVEPFAGGGAVFLALRSGVRAWINDINPELVCLYRVIRNNPDRLLKELKRMARQHSETFYYELRAQTLRSPIRKAARMIFLNKVGFNGLYRQNKSGEFNVPFGKYMKCPGLVDPNNLYRVSKKLYRTKLTNHDFEKVIDACGEGDFIYCDPPYEPLSTTSSFNSYCGNGFSRHDQTRLSDACARAAARGAAIVLSNSHSSFILKLYSNWDIHLVPARRSINADGAKRGKLNEICAVRLPSHPLTTH